MVRFERDIRRALETSFDCAVTFERGRKHNFVVISRRGWPDIRLSLSCSPSNRDTAVKEVVRDVRRRLQTGLTARAQPLH